MSMIRHTLLALGLSVAATSAIAETVYTFAYSNNEAYDTRYVSASVKPLESTAWEIDGPALKKRWRDALQANGYTYRSAGIIDTNLDMKGSSGNYYSSYDEADNARRVMINTERNKPVKVVNW